MPGREIPAGSAERAHRRGCREVRGAAVRGACHACERAELELHVQERGLGEEQEVGLRGSSVPAGKGSR